MNDLPSEPKPFRLHIGGTARAAGWTNFNILPLPEVDVVGSLARPLPFGTGAAEIVYAAHVIEHLSFSAELVPALKEIRRVLVPGGRFCVSVPDLDIIGPLIATPGLGIEDQLSLMAMIYGGQGDAYDFHKVGFNRSILSLYLIEAGFSSAARVDDFGFFDDTSRLKFKGQAISLNLVVT